MNAAGTVILLAGAVLLLMIMRSAIRSLFGGPSREEMLRNMDREERTIEQATGGTVPDCPVCGSPTQLHTYPHITVWRCTKYPLCRGFLKPKKPSRTQFAEDWDRKWKKKL
jgi:hypothetical protein